MSHPADHKYNMDTDETGLSEEDREYNRVRDCITKACPFCGCLAKVLEINGNRRDGRYVQCPACGARTAGCSTYSIALETWEKRVAPANI